MVFIVENELHWYLMSFNNPQQISEMKGFIFLKSKPLDNIFIQMLGLSK